MTEKLRKFTFTYSQNGKSYVLHIDAPSKEEAIERVKAMSQAKYEGEILTIIPVSKNSQFWFARLITRLLKK
ncbi:hypothetical protein [Glaesserella parasuis]|uniref:Phosphoribosylformylglycinamidine synthase subunit PurS n=1 Tax=Glaesserella parasuis TaxID=738 RepID=A0A859IH37_GLAPU|nr:hypothetical protein [Glaesserella parasuis]QKY73282.1 phosphoribosylformylglycinamidine synthase subunit PurS [Glaesserella parasuis]